MTKEDKLKKICKYCEKEFGRDTKYSYKQWETRIYCSNSCRGKMVVHSVQSNLKRAEAFRGERNPMNNKESRDKISGKNSRWWKGGLTKENQLLRSQMKFRNWRKTIFERDDYTCQECGNRGVTLNADHIKPFAYFPELRYLLSNGRTLCVDCHKMTDTYGRKARLMYE